MTEHTPGPWRCFPDNPEASISGYVIETETALEIATTGFGFGPEEDEANARLIAAAPELLEALVEAGKEINTFELLSKIDKVISKATRS